MRLIAFPQWDKLTSLLRGFFAQYGLLNQPSYRGWFYVYWENSPRQLAFNAWFMLHYAAKEE